MNNNKEIVKDKDNQAFGVIRAVVIDNYNRPTGEIENINISNIISPPCHGGCGLTTAECWLVFRACANWICRQRGCPSVGRYIRVPKHTEPDVCEECGSVLKLDDEDKAENDQIIHG